MPADRPGIWQPFVRAAIGISLIAGFGVGTLLFTSLFFGFSSGLWWPAAAQAHGHAQLFGWAGLMVLGIGLHFLPRLASTPGVAPGQARIGFWILISGLVLRLMSRPTMAIAEPEQLRRTAEIVWTIGVAGELAGVAVLVAGIMGSITAGRSLPAHPAVRPLLPLFAVSFLSLAAVLGSTLVLGLNRLTGSELPIDRTSSDRLILLMLYGFLIPVSVAMSARLFPLYVRTGSPQQRLLQAGLALLVSGTAFRLIGDQIEISVLESAGRILIPGAVVSFLAGTRVFGPRRALPRRPLRLWQDATGLHAVSAYVWLVGAAVVQLPGLRWQDLEIHLLGMGFVTLLIFGMGAHLIPGFGRETMRSPNYLWATLALGNLATICRAIPAIPDLHLASSLEQAIGASAGIAGLLALALFSVNVGGALTSRSGQHRTRHDSPPRDDQTQPDAKP